MLQRIRAARQEKENGFTLIELLIVIIILGVLAGIVVFAVRAVQDRGQAAACKADYRSVTTAMEAYYANHTPGDYPNAWADLVPQYLRDRPTGNGYAIEAWNDGSVQATGACTEGSAGPAGDELVALP